MKENNMNDIIILRHLNNYLFSLKFYPPSMDTLVVDHMIKCVQTEFLYSGSAPLVTFPLVHSPVILRTPRL